MNEKERLRLTSGISERDRMIEIKEREIKDKKRYLSEIIEENKPEWKNSNLILAPVGSGKSHLIENVLIPKNYNKKIIYLTSNTALKDSLCPPDNNMRKLLADKGSSKGFYTSENKKSFGDVPYSVHVMTYSEFGERIINPNTTFLRGIGLIFGDEIHSLPKYFEYDNSYKLGLALNWLFSKHDNIVKYFFTATNESIDLLEKRNPGFTKHLTIYNYLETEDIMKYVANSTHYISHIVQIRSHLRAKKESFDYHNLKALAFTKLIKDQLKIEEIAKSEGFKPISLWSINNVDNKMNEEQIRVRDYVLNTGLIPSEYNMLIINGSMQEGWNLHDDKLSLAIINTTDVTEQIQSLGRVRRDIDYVIKKTHDEELLKSTVQIPNKYLNVKLTKTDKDELAEELSIENSSGRIKKWRSLKKDIEDSGYNIEETFIYTSDKQMRASIITLDI